MIDKIFEHSKNANIKDGTEKNIFEILLYQNYIYKNKKELGYQFKDVDNAIQQHLTVDILNEYNGLFQKSLKGYAGDIERALSFLNKNNIDAFISLFVHLNLNIIRCEQSDLSNFKYQKKLIDALKPNILAASQGHFFGINKKNYYKQKIKFLKKIIYNKIKKEDGSREIKIFNIKFSYNKRKKNEQ